MVKRAGLLYITVVLEDDTIFNIEYTDLALDLHRNQFEARVDGEDYIIDLNDIDIIGGEF